MAFTCWYATSGKKAGWAGIGSPLKIAAATSSTFLRNAADDADGLSSVCGRGASSGPMSGDAASLGAGGDDDATSEAEALAGVFGLGALEAIGDAGCDDC